jgi:hypothetical protein
VPQTLGCRIGSSRNCDTTPFSQFQSLWL